MRCLFGSFFFLNWNVEHMLLDWGDLSLSLSFCLYLVESHSPYGQRTAVVCFKDRPTPRRYPRDPGTPTKEPLWCLLHLLFYCVMLSFSCANILYIESITRLTTFRYLLYSLGNSSANFRSFLSFCCLGQRWYGDACKLGVCNSHLNFEVWSPLHAMSFP